MIPCLTGPDVFACYCEPTTGDRLRVGILAASEDFEPGIHTLYAENGDRHRLIIPLVSSFTYNIELSYADIQDPR